MLNEFGSKKAIILLYQNKPLKCVLKGSEYFIEKVPNSLTIILSRLFFNFISILVFFNKKIQFKKFF